MKQMKGFQPIGLFLIFFIIPVLLNSTVAGAQDANLIRNGDFSGGLAEWGVNPTVGDNWTPLADGAVSLHPSAYNYQGTVIYQNLNITGIGGQSVQLQARLTAETPPPQGKTVAVYLTYVDTANTLYKIKILNPDNTTIPRDPNDPGAVFSMSYPFPAQARKLVKLEVAKEDYGSFFLDDVTLTTGAAVTTGDLPVISTLSSTSGAYQSTLTLSGTNFGPAEPVVLINGSPDGVTVTSASPTALVVEIRDPAGSGQVCVISDYVESNVNHTFEITSPNYTVDMQNDKLVAVKGQTVEFVLRLDFLNGFTTGNGVNFTVQGLPQDTPVTFLPVPLKNTGGVLLKIDTTPLAAGDYSFSIQADDGIAAPRTVAGFLEVVTISDIRFFESVWDPAGGTNITTYLTEKTVTTQGYIVLSVDAVDSKGKIWDTWGSNSPLRLKSGNPDIVGVYEQMFGPDLYALESGTADLVVTAADGYEENLPLTVSLTQPYVTSILLSPRSVANTSTADIVFQAQADGVLKSSGYSSTGMMTFNTNFLENVEYGPGFLSCMSTFQLLDPPTDLGLVLFNTSTETNTRVVPLYIENDPELSEFKGGVRLLDNVFAESFLLEFYDPADGAKPLFTRQVFLGHDTNDIHLGGITPGTYKLRFLAEGDALRPQWYPNADDFSTALPVQFTKGLVENIYFFNRGYPTISFAGSVKNGGDNYPAVGIDAASVQVVEAGNIWASTAVNGDFYLPGIRADKDFELTVTKGGFTTVYSEIFNETENLQAILPYALIPAETLAEWGNTSGNGAVIGRVTRQNFPMEYLDGASVTAVNADDGTQTFPVTYQDPVAGTFGGSATYDNGVFAVLNVPAGVTVKLTVAKSGWTFARPSSRVTVRADALCETSFFGTSVEESAIRTGFESAMAAFEAGNLEGFMSYVSADFLDDGMNRSQFETEISRMIDAGEPQVYVIQSITVNGDQAVMNVVWNGIESDTLCFQKEGETWMLYGNQQEYAVIAFSGHSSNSYWVEMIVEDPNDTITGVSVAGPGITDTINLNHDATRHDWVSWAINPPYINVGPEFGTNPPTPPLEYTFTITDSLGTSSVSATVKSFVEVFAVSGYPSKDQAVSPLASFSWSGVGTEYSYGVELSDATGTRLWDAYDITGTTVAYTGRPLAPGDFYYNLLVRDREENFSMVTIPFSVIPSKGDINADGQVTLIDSLLALKVLSGLDSTGVTVGDTAAPLRMEEAMYILQDAGGVRPDTAPADTGD